MHEVTALLSHSLQQYRPGLIFVNAGVNNLSKTYLYENEASTKYELTGLENVISQHTARSSCARVILTYISATKDGRVNARAIDINGRIEQSCARNGWLFMDNKNFTTEDLRDTVNFNYCGEGKFIAKLQDSICKSMC